MSNNELLKLLDNALNESITERMNMEPDTIRKDDISKTDFLTSFEEKLSDDLDKKWFTKNLVSLVMDYLNDSDIVIDKKKLEAIMRMPKFSYALHKKMSDITFKPYGNFERDFGSLATKIAGIISDGN